MLNSVDKTLCLILFLFSILNSCNATKEINFDTLRNSNVVKMQITYSYKNDFDTLNVSPNCKFNGTTNSIHFYRPDGLRQTEKINLPDGSQNLITLNYDSDNKLIFQELINDRFVSRNRYYNYQYDDVEKKEAVYYNGNKQFEFKFNEEGLMIHEKQYNQEEVLIHEAFFEYDEDKLISHKIYKNQSIINYMSMMSKEEKRN